MKNIILSFLFCMTILSLADIDPAQCRIVIPPKAGPTVDFAAKELQKHLQIISGMEIPVTQVPG
ncbi:MAG: hypothetical protein PHT27_07330, partial [Candidatus Izemoplasmatales bacterium]|nr:hypothetical protein [Candidatus Izemoplasmatales bacterium]